MILSKDELEWLCQLVDRDHSLSTDRAGLEVRLSSTPENEWAREQVEDWRARHSPLCHCWKS